MYPSIVAALLADDDTPIEARRVTGKGLTLGEYGTASTLEHATAHPQDAAALARAASTLAGRIFRGAERWRRAAGELQRMSGADLRAFHALSWVERAQSLAPNLLGSGPDRHLPGGQSDDPASLAAALAADAIALTGRARSEALWNAARLLIEVWRTSRDVPGAHVDAWVAMRDTARELGFAVPAEWSHANHPHFALTELEWTP